MSITMLAIIVAAAACLPALVRRMGANYLLPAVPCSVPDYALVLNNN